MARYLLILEFKDVAMKGVFGFLLGCFLAGSTYAQTDLPTTTPLKIGPKPTLDVKVSPTPNATLRIPAVVDMGKAPNLNNSMTPNVKMLPDRDLKQAGHDLVIDPKISEAEIGINGNPNGGNPSGGNMYLGDVKTKSQKVTVVYRDFGEVDGDRVRITSNNQIIEMDFLLTGSFKRLILSLDQGFNSLEFQALNQGYVGYNTAQVNVYHDMGNLILTNSWHLAVGSKASMVIVKQ